jgi:hypothetical protein
MVWLDAPRGVGGVLLTQTRWAGNDPFRRQFERKVDGVFGD